MRYILQICLFISSSCALGAQDDYPDYVVWGSYCGECISRCSTFRKISGSSLQIDKSDRIFQIDPYNPIDYAFSGSSSEADEFAKYEWLLRSKKPSILKENTTIFGMPDAHDQCGYFLNYSVKGQSYRSLIDPHNIPVELEEIVDRLFK